MSTQLKLIQLQPNGKPLDEPILGLGRTGVVVQREGYAVKLPLKYKLRSLLGNRVRSRWHYEYGSLRLLVAFFRKTSLMVGACCLSQAFLLPKNKL
jgi:hypothetical protein